MTFEPTTSFDIMEREISIPLVMDDINEALEGFFLVIDTEGIADQTLDIELERGGVTLVNIVDDDRKFNLLSDNVCWIRVTITNCFAAMNSRPCRNSGTCRPHPTAHTCSMALKSSILLVNSVAEVVCG